mgnify:CR=1 FL=1
MHLKITRPATGKEETVKGKEARTILKQVLSEISKNILIPEPPYTGIVRRRAIDALRNGNSIWTEIDDNGHPLKGIIVSMPPRIVGIIGTDGVYKSIDGDDNESGK